MKFITISFEKAIAAPQFINTVSHRERSMRSAGEGAGLRRTVQYGEGVQRSWSGCGVPEGRRLLGQSGVRMQPYL